MARSIRDLMNSNLISMPMTSTVAEAARKMRDADIGDVIVLDDGQLRGIVTDRDIVIRAIADGRDPATVKLGDICSRDLTTLSPTDTVDDAVRLMRDKAIRRYHRSPRFAIWREGRPPFRRGQGLKATFTPSLRASASPGALQ